MRYNRKILQTLLIILLSSVSISCEHESIKEKLEARPKIDLQNSFYWAECTKESNPDEIFSNDISETAKYNFKPVLRMGGANLKELVGPFGTFIWLKADFTIPDNLKDQNLGLFIQYLHFSNEVWINEHFIGSSGLFPPNEKSNLYTPHQYTIPKEFLYQDSNNTLLLKVWCHGDSEISKNVYIQNELHSKFSYTNANYYSTVLYMNFEGLFFTAFLLYLLIFIAQRKSKIFLTFSLTCLFTVIFTFVFYVPSIPVFQYVSGPKAHLNFYKWVVSISSYFIFYFFSAFLIYYTEREPKKLVHIIRFTILAVQVLITIVVPTYNALIKLFPFLISLSLVQIILAIPYIIIASLKKEKRRQLRTLFFSSISLLLGMIEDFILRILLKNTALPYFTFIGFILFNITFIFVLMIRFLNLYRTNEYLTSNLQKEVENQTKQIRNANILLADELKKSKIDMHMAAIVQQKMFKSPQKTFVGWDFSIIYDPLEEVSGDMFDFYYMGGILEGLSIFDVSGHGIASSLITFLSKSIIFSSFRSTRFAQKKMSNVLKEINASICHEKAGVDNYLTGIICHFSPIEETYADVEFANAGHPHPFLYSAELDKVIELEPKNKTENFGAIGLTGTDVNYVDINLKMGVGDIILFFTDGLIEALNKNGEQFGKNRIAELLNENHSESASKITEILKNSMIEHCGDRPRQDDLTIIALKREKTEDYLEALTDE